MRITAFNEKIFLEFGSSLGDNILKDHILVDLKSKTPSQAIEAGIDPKQVWLAICEDFQVPSARR